MHLKLSPCDHKDLANAAKGEEERRWLARIPRNESLEFFVFYFRTTKFKFKLCCRSIKDCSYGIILPAQKSHNALVPDIAN
jgi:hypothetical protein